MKWLMIRLMNEDAAQASDDNSTASQTTNDQNVEDSPPEDSETLSADGGNMNSGGSGGSVSAGGGTSGGDMGSGGDSGGGGSDGDPWSDEGAGAESNSKMTKWADVVGGPQRGHANQIGNTVWSSGVSRGHANPDGTEGPWQSGIARSVANELTEAIKRKLKKFK